MNRPETGPKSDIDATLARRKIIITCGTGGVGKTTLSAAIAIRAALQGRRTVVITIDPAKRLANSLGLQTLQDGPTDLTSVLQKALARNNQTQLKGTLTAIVPDTQKTFESFVSELAPNPLIAKKILQNPIFQIFAKEFSGTNEYMALERLLTLHKQANYDCIILDTPPSRNTLAFLEAPKVLSQLFEEKIIRWLVLPANKIVSLGMKKALSILERLTGAGFMTNLFDFAAALFEVQVKFSANLKTITALLESPDVGFLMVSTPTPVTHSEANHFIANLRQHHFHFDGMILNRTLGYLKEDPSIAHPQNDKALNLLRALQERERHVLENFIKNSNVICAKLPELARDVHSVEDLLHVALALNDSSLSSRSAASS